MSVKIPNLTTFNLPTSEIATAADALVAEVAPAFIYNHSVRSFVFAREVAKANGLIPNEDYDEELVFLSCILHDLGATDHANGDQRFEVDGADAAAEFLRSRDVEEARIKAVWNSIALHTSDGIAHRFGPVEGVTQMGISADILGRCHELLPADFADGVHAVWPRFDLGYALAEVIAHQVDKNPAKGSFINFPGHVHQLYYPTPTKVTWFDAVKASGWNDQPGGAISDTSDSASDPCQLSELFVRYFNGRDFDALRSLYEPAAFFAPSPGEAKFGADAIKGSLQAMAEAGATIDLDTRRMQIVSDLAIISNTATVMGAAPDGTALVTTTTEIARRQSDGRWLYVFDDPFFSL